MVYQRLHRIDIQGDETCDFFILLQHEPHEHPEPYWVCFTIKHFPDEHVSRIMANKGVPINLRDEFSVTERGGTICMLLPVLKCDTTGVEFYVCEDARDYTIWYKGQNLVEFDKVVKI